MYSVYQILAPLINLFDIGSLYAVLMCQTAHDSQSVGEVLCEVAAAEVGDEAALDLLHGRQEVLEGLNGTQLAGQRRRIRALVVVEDGGDAALANG